MAQQVYTAAEAAQLLRMSVWTFYDKVKEGLIPVHRDGRIIKVTQANINDYLRRIELSQPTQEGTQ